MVNLTKPQKEITDRLASARARYDKNLQELDLTYRYEKAQLKNEIKNLILEAEAAGVPRRQQHLAVGFAQVGQLVNFLEGQSGTPGMRLTTAARTIVEAPENKPVQPLIIEKVKEDTIGADWQVRDHDGSVFTVLVYPSGDAHEVYEVDFKDHENAREEVLDRLREEYGTLIVTD